MSPDPPQKAPWWWSHDPAARLMVRSGPRSPESGAPPQFPQIIYSDWGTKLLHSSPLLLRRVQLLTGNLNQGQTPANSVPNNHSKYFVDNFLGCFLLAIPKCEHNETNESNVWPQRPQQDLHDNKTNCSLGRGIQTYFSIYTALHALTVILAKK